MEKRKPFIETVDNEDKKKVWELYFKHFYSYEQIEMYFKGKYSYNEIKFIVNERYKMYG